MRTALVTGGSRGIGAAVVWALECAGYEVLAPTREEVDLSHPGDVLGWMSLHPTTPDVLVFCAGINRPEPLQNLRHATWEETLSVNTTAPFLLMRRIGLAMAARGAGRIVSVSSLYGSGRARAGRAAYSASKAALEALTRTAAVEFGPRGVLVNAVAPGFVETDMTRRNNPPEQIEAWKRQIPLGRLAIPEEIAAVVAWLASPANTYINGQTIVVDGGFSLQ